jgi:hypothetical protein
MEDDSNDLFIINPIVSSEMPRSNEVCFVAKKAITNILECILACITYISTIYILLLIYGLVGVSHLELTIKVIGYLSLFSLVTTPVGSFGCNRTSYCALFTFILIASYHLYGIVMYFWLILKLPNFASNQQSEIPPLLLKYELLHYLISGSYAFLVTASIILAICKIVSLVQQIEPARVVVVDNTE